MDTIQRIEDHVRQAMSGQVAHDYKHVDRVRRWALRIAAEEGFGDLAIVEIAALLHDIGLLHVDEENERSKHGQVGAEITREYLAENSSLTEEQIEQIASAIRYHGSPPSEVAGILETIGEKGRLMAILRDADTMDALGAVGLMRAFTSKSAMPEYTPGNVRGDTWGLSSSAFDERFANGLGIGETIIDQINFQISLCDNLRTAAAKRWARPLVAFLREYIIHLEREITT